MVRIGWNGVSQYWSFVGSGTNRGLNLYYSTNAKIFNFNDSYLSFYDGTTNNYLVSRFDRKNWIFYTGESTTGGSKLASFGKDGAITYTDDGRYMLKLSGPSLKFYNGQTTVEGNYVTHLSAAKMTYNNSTYWGSYIGPNSSYSISKFFAIGCAYEEGSGSSPKEGLTAVYFKDSVNYLKHQGMSIIGNMWLSYGGRIKTGENGYEGPTMYILHDTANTSIYQKMAIGMQANSRRDFCYAYNDKIYYSVFYWKRHYNGEDISNLAMRVYTDYLIHGDADNRYIYSASDNWDLGIKTIRFQSGGQLNCYNYNGNGYGYTPDVSSDIRLKKDVYDSTIEALPVILKLKHREFTYKENNKFKEIGYIAQEIKEIKEDFVYYLEKFDENGNIIDKQYNINSKNIIPYITKAQQEMYEIIQKQQKEIEFLKNKIETLNSVNKINDIENCIDISEEVDEEIKGSFLGPKDNVKPKEGYSDNVSWNVNKDKEIISVDNETGEEINMEDYKSVLNS